MKMKWRILFLVSIAVLAGACGGHRAAVPPMVDQAATPHGWVPIAYGATQISVPADWVIGLCPESPSGTVILGVPAVFCPERIIGPTVSVTPLAQPFSTNKPVDVNGITAYAMPNDVGAYAVPSLGVQVSGTGKIFSEIFATITHSPRAVVLGSGPAPPVPRSWHRVDLSGFSVAVPRTWPLEQSTRSNACEPSFAFPPGFGQKTRLYTGESTLVRCAFTKEVSVRAIDPVNGLVIDPGATRPYDQPTPIAQCLTVNKLKLCPVSSPSSDVLLLSAKVPGISRPVVVELGLRGSGVTARTILFSIRGE